MTTMTKTKTIAELYTMVDTGELSQTELDSILELKHRANGEPEPIAHKREVEVGKAMVKSGWRQRRARPRTTSPTPEPIPDSSYNGLQGKWLDWLAVATRYEYKVLAQDRPDTRHNIMIALAKAQSRKPEPLPIATRYRIASCVVADYWRTQYKLSNGLDCGSCSKAQRQKCKRYDLYLQCPKAVKVESLSQPIVDSQGNLTELGDLIADDKALDLDAWIDNSTWLLGCKARLIQIANKKLAGISLTAADSRYLYKFRRREQKKLL